MQRKYFLLFFFLLNCMDLIGQRQLTGKVVSLEGAPLRDVHVILSDINKSKPLSFVFTDLEGRFVLVVPDYVVDSVAIRFSGLGYKSKVVSFSLKSGFEVPQVRLQTNTQNLPDVVVKSGPIIQRRDTISYDVKTFTDQQDRVLADVLRKMPGIEVTDNGTVKYQGRLINRYYIEGLNLLDGKYSLANNNIPVDAVEQVQILENHQPLKVLDSVSISNRAALNVKLKAESKNKIIGRAKTGAGFPLFLADVEMVPMRFGNNEQMLFTYKYNNAGFNYANELSNLIEEFSSPIKTEVLSIPFPALPSFSQQRYLFNNQHVGSLNYLKKSKQAKELKVIFDVVHDIQRQTSSINNALYFGFDTIRINELHQFRMADIRMNGKMELVSNTENKFTLSGLKAGVSRLRNDAEIFSSQLARQKLNDHFVWAEAYGRLVWKINKWIHGFQYQAGYNIAPQELHITPDLSGYFSTSAQKFDSILQQSTTEKVYAKTGYSVALSLGRFSLEQALSADFNRSKYQAPLNMLINGQSILIDDTINNQFAAKEFSSIYMTKLSYRANKLKFSAQIPFHYFIHNNNNEQKNYLDRLFVTYDFSGQYIFNSHFNILLNHNKDIMLLPAYFSSDRFTMSNYRSLVNYEGIIKWRYRNASTVQLFYKNSIRSLFGNFFFSKESMVDNYLMDQRFNGRFLIGKAINRDNPSLIYRGGFSLSKYISKLKTTITIATSSQQSSGQQSNSGQISFYKVHTTGLTAKLNARVKLFSFDYVGLVTQIKSNINDRENWNRTYTEGHTLSISYAFQQKYLIKWGLEINKYIADERSPRQFIFSDFLIRKNLEKRKINVELYWQNIFNLRQMETIMVNANAINIQTYQLRPSQCMLRINFNL
ncbi:MAG: Plug and carboxypeptidase regulatory-like domain-containing protein [Sediminibacterium sp.]|nr:Plug and carboxypeptidase regulatory-like domain-containing protein [Sediminibacterium sp.]